MVYITEKSGLISDLKDFSSTIGIEMCDSIFLQSIIDFVEEQLNNFLDNSFYDYFLSYVIALESVMKLAKEEGLLEQISQYYLPDMLIDFSIKITNSDMPEGKKENVFGFFSKMEGLLPNDTISERLWFRVMYLGTEIAKLSSESEILNFEIQELRGRIDKLSSEVDNLRGCNKKLQDRLKSVPITKRKQAKEDNWKIRDLMRQNERLQKKIDAHKTMGDDELNAEIEKLKEVIRGLRAELERKKIANEKANINVSFSEDEEKIQAIIELIFRKSFVTKEMVVEYLKTKGYGEISLDLAVTYLSEIEKRISIERIYRDGVKYRLKKLDDRFQTKTSFWTNGAAKKVFLMSDPHIQKEEDAKVLDLVNDYCVREGVGAIWTLGDIIDVREIDAYVKYAKTVSLIEYIARYMSLAPGVCEWAMGGNHDRDGLNLGIDVMRMYTSSRGCIDMGYIDATIFIDDNGQNGSKIRWHHFLNQISQGSNNGEMKYRYKTYLGRNDFDVAEPFCTLLGGTHKFLWGPRMVYLPALILGNDNCGALEMTISTGKKGINKASFELLTVENGRLVKNERQRYEIDESKQIPPSLHM